MSSDLTLNHFYREFPFYRRWLIWFDTNNREDYNTQATVAYSKVIIERKQWIRRWQQERKKNNRFQFAKQQLCMCIMLFMLHNCDVSVRNFMFCRGHEHKTTTLFFFSWTLIQSCRIQLQKNLPTYLLKWRVGISSIKFEAVRLHFVIGIFSGFIHIFTTLELSELIFKAVIIINWKGLLFFVILEKPFTVDFVVLNLSFYT